MENKFLEIRKFVAPEYIYGENARLLATEYCRKLAVRQLLVVSDRNLKETIWFREMESMLQDAHIPYVVYDKVSPNPRDYEVMEGAAFFMENKCNMLLALGGGSVIDCAKAIGIVATNGGHIKDYEGVDQIPSPMPPLISIPTTSGSSADVSQFAIINNTTDQYKMAIISKALLSDIALIDPLVLQTMPASLSANTGMDAFSHAFEAYVSNASSPMTDLYAMEAIRLLNQHLTTTIKEPSNTVARGKVMLASLYAGLAFSNASLGCVHAMAHSLGGQLDLPHGECNAILLPHVIDFNFASAADKYTDIAKAMQLNTKASAAEVKQNLLQRLEELRTELGIRDTLSAKGVTLDVIQSLSKNAYQDPCNATNPRQPALDDLQALFREAM